jgi:hypothetical protein
MKENTLMCHVNLILLRSAFTSQNICNKNQEIFGVLMEFKGIRYHGLYIIIAIR